MSIPVLQTPMVVLSSPKPYIWFKTKKCSTSLLTDWKQPFECLNKVSMAKSALVAMVTFILTTVYVGFLLLLLQKHFLSLLVFNLSLCILIMREMNVRRMLSRRVPTVMIVALCHKSPCRTRQKMLFSFIWRFPAFVVQSNTSWSIPHSGVKLLEQLICFPQGHLEVRSSPSFLQLPLSPTSM